MVRMGSVLTFDTFTERHHRRMGLREAAGGYDKLLGLVAVDRRDERVAVGEMAVESPGPDTSGARDLIEAGAGSLFSESGLRCFEQADAVALRIGSRLTDSDGFVFISHAENSP
jgi:hypothetical protein